MKTDHGIVTSDSRHLKCLEDESVDLVLTSPPYPMIEMWDNLFSSLSSDAKAAMDAENGVSAFAAMHDVLDVVWSEVRRVMKPGAIACVNIGDATRRIGSRFMLYPNHSRVTDAFGRLGFDPLPVILWRKQTNAPNKFMGSGMLPCGAYVTLEHEYILVFRKGGKRDFAGKADRELRMESSYFWEERNKWFSDVWDIKGSQQKLGSPELRSRSAAFPFEIAYRLVNMYSVYGDTVLDPFAGTGTVTLACIACGRNSVSVDLEPAFARFALDQASAFKDAANRILFARVDVHRKFVSDREAAKGVFGYENERLGLRVMTRQETRMMLYAIAGIERKDGAVTVRYEPLGGGEAMAVAEIAPGASAVKNILQPDFDF